MDLGAFSISLTVEDLARSRTFYETLGFEGTGGDPEHGYLILVNGRAAELPEAGGPGHVAFVDPDGNPVLIDQHR